MTTDRSARTVEFGGGPDAMRDCDALMRAFVEQHLHSSRTNLVGIAGPQGSGKSTSAARLAAALRRSGIRCALLALDDFYLDLPQRLELAREVHPLLKTRGVPGTHDLALLDSCIRSLAERRRGLVTVPVFDKLRDCRLPSAKWRPLDTGADIILLEGWCVGARPQPAAELVGPANQLEEEEDPDGVWRCHVNDQLASGYAALFGSLDANILFRPPSFEIVSKWRSEQERALVRPGAEALAMSDAGIARFVQHFERLTRWLDRDSPAGLLISLDERRRPLRAIIAGSAPGRPAENGASAGQA